MQGKVSARKFAIRAKRALAARRARSPIPVSVPPAVPPKVPAAGPPRARAGAKPKARAAVTPRPRPAATPADRAANNFRLVPEPVFILSYMRSGSTLLRVVLNSHSKLCAPHEMHLSSVKVELKGQSESALGEIGFRARWIENLVWDRVLFDQLTRSGKPHIIDKTPGNSLWWRRIHKFWPDAKFIILYRHPVRVMESWERARPEIKRQRTIAQMLRFAKALERARNIHGGLVVRYEEFTRDPAKVSQEICEFIGVPWEPQMVAYGEQDHGNFVRGLGDWSEKIQSGAISPAPPDPKPEDVPDDLKEICRLMGYL